MSVAVHGRAFYDEEGCLDSRTSWLLQRQHIRHQILNLLRRQQRLVVARHEAILEAADQIVEDLQVRRERFGFSYIVPRQGMADAFAPVVERLSVT